MSSSRYLSICSILNWLKDVINCILCRLISADISATGVVKSGSMITTDYDYLPDCTQARPAHLLHVHEQGRVSVDLLSEVLSETHCGAHHGHKLWQLLHQILNILLLGPQNWTGGRKPWSWLFPGDVLTIVGSINVLKFFCVCLRVFMLPAAVRRGLKRTHVPSSSSSTTSTPPVGTSWNSCSPSYTREQFKRNTSTLW